MRWIRKNKNRIALFILGAFGGASILIILFAISYVQIALRSANISPYNAVTLLKTALSKQEYFQDTTVTFLILGLDKRNDEFESTLLTDTIILASLDTGNNALNLIPIPRDLWIRELQTKVNALYYYGEQKNGGAEYEKAEIERISGVSIDYYIILNYAALPELIDALGGVNITIEKSFVDTQYPNSDYIDNPDNTTIPRYITVSFVEGKQTLNGEQALQYVRSRHSNDESQGSDLARSKRQTQLIQAIANSLRTPSILMQPAKLGKLYRYWKDNIDTNMTDSDALSLILSIHPPELALNSITIPTSWDSAEPIFSHPKTEKYGLWVWEPVDASWSQLKEFFTQTL